MKITVDTKLLALLGTPMRQSISPACHSALYESLGWDYIYLPLEVKTKEDLGPVLEGIRRMNFAGFAITKPYKEEILQYLDQTDHMVDKIGSCNTVQIKDGVWTGYNTDGVGAITSLELEGGVRFAGETFFCFGSGGTGKSVCLEIAARGARRIYIASRSQMCEELADHINSSYPGVCQAIRMAETDAIRQAVAASGVVLNLSGLGMYPHLDETPITRADLRPGQICFDATYNPEKPLFLQEAEAAGCKTVNGLGMLVYQGTRQIAIWMGQPEPHEAMYQIMRREMEERSRQQ